MKNIFSTVVATALFVASAVNAAVPTLQPITDAELAKNLGQAQIRQAIKSFGAKDKTPTRRAWITNDVKLNQFIYDSIHNANLNYIIVDLREASKFIISPIFLFPISFYFFKRKKKNLEIYISGV